VPAKDRLAREKIFHVDPVNDFRPSPRFPLTFRVRHPLLQGFHEVFYAVIPPWIAAPGVPNAVAAVAVVSGVAELAVDVVAVGVVVLYVAGPAVCFASAAVVDPEVSFVLELWVSEPGSFFAAVVFVVPVSAAGTSAHRAFADIVLAFEVSFPVSVVAV
jgi:hypothetical protein